MFYASCLFNSVSSPKHVGQDMLHFECVTYYKACYIMYILCLDVLFQSGNLPDQGDFQKGPVYLILHN